MAFKNVLRETRKIIYNLKRQFGLLMYIQYASSDDVYDLETGEITRTITDIKIRRGVLLPEDTLRKFVYDLSFIAANKNFTYGGFFEKGARVVLIDVKDLPSGFIIKNSMYINFHNRRYEIQKSALIPDNDVGGYAWLLAVAETKSSSDRTIS